ncbi:MAG: DUF262 domain-containing protein [Betaproteobacteria bacterium]|nr:DUF262 domain-containing protein [Betaproteobacteria bacterium]
MTTTAKAEEEQTFFEEDRDQPIPPENVVAYNELRSCADLHRMHASGKLEIQPDFQRDVVWKVEEQARFIDSLVKQLPIPSMCFSLDANSKTWKVIDGLQRMHTITSFLGTAEWRIAPADDIHPLLKGKKNVQLRNGSEEERKLYASVEDISIPITVIRCDYRNPSHMRYLFTIFNRLNSGGVRLNNQEIRNCIYSGQFNDMLKSVDRAHKPWHLVHRRIWGKMDRFRSVEILLRMLAFSDWLEKYEGNLAGFLNEYMLFASKSSAEEIANWRASLERSTALAAKVVDSLGSGKRSLTFMEGILVGVTANLSTAPAPASAQATTWAKERAEKFKTLPTFSAGARYALSSAQTVKERLRQAIAAFA